MFHIALYEPEIPPNTGNIIRLCANCGAALHLIHPLGFSMENKLLQRAGLDYRELANVSEHASYEEFLQRFPGHRLFAISTRGSRYYNEVDYRPGDIFLFGPETRGLPQSILDEAGEGHRLRIPMAENSRSLNLSNSAAIIVYEAWRQNGYQIP